MIRDIDWAKAARNFKDAAPFNYVVIDNFFNPEVADKLSSEFPDPRSEVMNTYKNPLEDKLTLNQWDKFPNCTYRAFTALAKESFVKKMQDLIDDPLFNFDGNTQLVMDYGLNGGGWHMHGRGGNNNIHLDYNIHPKLGWQRKLNIIIYLSKDWDTSWGGGLELWSHDYETNKPLELVKTVENIFNRAIIFDTTQNSWHGLPNSINCPDGVYRKSMAAYYVTPAPAQTEQRGRALFVAREDQKDDASVQDLILKRASVTQSADVYRK